MKFTSFFFVSFFVAVAAFSARAQSTFPDVPDDHWAAQAVKKLAEAGIIEGRLERVSKEKTKPKKPTSFVTAELPPGFKLVKTGKPIWGKEIRGLQAGIRLYMSKPPFHKGEGVSFDFLVRNVSDEPITIEVPDPHSFAYPTYFEAKVVYETGKVLSFEQQFALKFGRVYNGDPGRKSKKILASKEIFEFPHGVSLFIGVPDSDSTGASVDLEAGKYKVSFSTINSSEEPDVWTDELESGQFPIEVVEKKQAVAQLDADKKASSH